MYQVPILDIVLKTKLLRKIKLHKSSDKTNYMKQREYKLKQENRRKTLYTCLEC